MKFGRRLWWAIGLSVAPFAGDLRAGVPTWNEEENYVLKILANGNVAQLQAEDPSIRKFSTRFLRHLLTLPKDQIPPEGVNIRHAIVDEDGNQDADFTAPNLEVPYEVRFEHCEFRGRVDLSGSRFSKGLSFAHSTFKAGSRFERIQVDGHLDLRQTVFAQAFSASYAKIAGNLIGSGAHFKGPTTFSQINVGHSVDLNTLDTNQPTTFSKQADWSGASVGYKFLAWHVRFDEAAIFDSLKVGGTVWMQSCRFGGKTSFGYGKVGEDLDASLCQFTAPGEKVNFYSLACGSLTLDDSRFNSGADFGNAAIANDLSLCKARFTSKAPVSFYAANIKGTTYLNDAEFLGPVNFILAHIGGNFSAVRARFWNTEELTKPSDSEEVQRSTFNADFGSLAVEGFTFLNKASFAGDISFRNARIQNLVLDDVQWPTTNKSLRLEGLSYQRIRSVTNEVFVLNPADLEKSWENLRRTLVKHTPYSFDVYDNLEAYFLREGQPELANDVFIEGKRRERNEADLSAKWWSLFLDLTVGQGRKPGRAFLLSLLPIGLGWWCFQKIKMKPTDSRIPPNEIPYHSLWFSLDLFLPILDLWITNKWEPKPEQKWLWAYACFHKFLGWMLIPVGLAAFAGIVK